MGASRRSILVKVFCGALIAATLAALLICVPHIVRGVRWKRYSNLGGKAYQQASYVEAEKHFLAALKLAEGLQPEDPRLLASLKDMEALHKVQGRWDKAEHFCRRKLAIEEKTLGPEHPNVVESLKWLAELCAAQGKYAEAEPLYRRALAIDEKALGAEHPDVAMDLISLALFYDGRRKYAQAEPFFRRALAVWERALGPEDSNVATTLESYALLLRNTGRDAEAEKLEARARAIRAVPGVESPRGRDTPPPHPPSPHERP